MHLEDFDTGNFHLASIEVKKCEGKLKIALKVHKKSQEPKKVVSLCSLSFSFYRDGYALWA
jgi:hypothetical protein